MAENEPAASTPTPQQTQPTPSPANKPGGYGKRPLWQWILLYVIVGGILYFVIYYFFFRHTGATSIY